MSTTIYSGTREADGTTLVSVNGRPLDIRTGFRKESATTSTRVSGVAGRGQVGAAG